MQTIVWASGNAWGRDSFVLKTDCILPGASVDAAFQLLRIKDRSGTTCVWASSKLRVETSGI